MLSVLVWQGGGAKVSVGEVSDLLAGEERAQLPRLLLPAEGGFRWRAQDSAPAQSRDLQLSQQGEHTVHWILYSVNNTDKKSKFSKICLFELKHICLTEIVKVHNNMVVCSWYYCFLTKVPLPKTDIKKSVHRYQHFQWAKIGSWRSSSHKDAENDKRVKNLFLS